MWFATKREIRMWFPGFEGCDPHTLPQCYIHHFKKSYSWQTRSINRIKASEQMSMLNQSCSHPLVANWVGRCKLEGRQWCRPSKYSRSREVKASPSNERHQRVQSNNHPVKPQVLEPIDRWISSWYSMDFCLYSPRTWVQSPRWIRKYKYRWKCENSSSKIEEVGCYFSTSACTMYKYFLASASPSPLHW